MELSKRLQAVADLLESHSCVADIGCDHGFVSIYLIRSRKAEKCIAMDVNKGPIQRAAQHISEEGLSTYIETRLSDGAKELKFLTEEGEGNRLEVQAAIIAGMGGKLTIKIIEDSLEKFLAMEEFILQPQSEIWKVREYLASIGCEILKEDMIFEDGKFYPMMKAAFKNISDKKTFPCKIQELFYYYGEDLLQNQNPVLYDFLINEKKLYEEILEQLSCTQTEKTQMRKQEILAKLNRIQKGLEWF
ncbi:MAG: SAM-dependent methyltransferase [Lachnospiraceae bacterium]|nr:SAM-dependent methyltransferase [Lachnospiraceae bacterium]